jgi:CRP-like cAMP-binding protein
MLLTAEGRKVRISESEQMLHDHPLTQTLSPAHTGSLAECAGSRIFQPGEYLWRQGEKNEDLLLVLTGEVALEIFIPNQGPLRVDHVRAGEALACSWLTASARCVFDARAVTTTQVVLLDGAKVRRACEQDGTLGYQLLKRVTPLLAQTLQRTRLRLVEHYRP